MGVLGIIIIMKIRETVFFFLILRQETGTARGVSFGEGEVKDDRNN